jgi:FHS family glucose/mannose:H+ symporter-like MFS transporter
VIWPYVILAYLSLIIYGLSDNIRGPLFPELIRYFGVTNTQGSWFYAIASIFAFIGSWACLHTLKRVNRVQNLYLALSLLALGLVCMALSRTFPQLLAAAAVFGIGLGQTAVIYNLLITVGTSHFHRQRLVSGLHTMYAVSSFTAPLAVAAIYRAGGSWPQCFLLAAFLCVTLVIVGAMTFRSEDTELEHEISDETAEVAEAALTIPAKRPPGIYVISAAFGFYVVAEILIGSRLALYLRIAKNFDLEKSSYYMTGFFLCLLSSRLLFSLVPFRKASIYRQLLISLALSFFMMILGVCVHQGFFMLTGLTMGPFYAMSVIYLSQIYPKSLNQAIPLTMSLQSLFVVIMHLASGWMTDQWGIARAMLAGPLCLAAAFILLWRFPRWKRH